MLDSVRFYLSYPARLVERFELIQTIFVGSKLRVSRRTDAGIVHALIHLFHVNGALLNLLPPISSMQTFVLVALVGLVFRFVSDTDFLGHIAKGRSS